MRGRRNYSHRGNHNFNNNHNTDNRYDNRGNNNHHSNHLNYNNNNHNYNNNNHGNNNNHSNNNFNNRNNNNNSHYNRNDNNKNFHTNNHYEYDNDSNDESDSSKPIIYHGIPMYEGKRKIANDTLDIIRLGSYTLNRLTVNIKKEIDQCVNLTKVYQSTEEINIFNLHTNGSLCKFEFTVESTLEAAHRIIETNIKDVAVLNFASPTKPGGGWINGRDAQEETITRESALYLSISSKDPTEKFYKFHSSLLKSDDPEKNLYTDTIIYSPKVPVIRDSDREELLPKPFLVSFITSAATNLKLLLEDYQRVEKGSKLPNIYKYDNKKSNFNENYSQRQISGYHYSENQPKLVSLNKNEVTSSITNISQKNNQVPKGNYLDNNHSHKLDDFTQSRSFNNQQQSDLQISSHNSAMPVNPKVDNNFPTSSNIYQNQTPNFQRNSVNQGNTTTNTQLKPSFPDQKNDNSNPRRYFNSNPNQPHDSQVNKSIRSNYDGIPAENQSSNNIQPQQQPQLSLPKINSNQIQPKTNFSRTNNQQNGHNAPPLDNQKPTKSSKNDDISTIKDKNRETMHGRCEKIIKVCISNHNKAIILGAFGCGIFGNDPAEIAEIFYEILVRQKLGNYLDLVVFAFKGAKTDGYTFTSFKNKFMTEK